MTSELRSTRKARHGALAAIIAAVGLLMFGFAAPASADTSTQIANGLTGSRLYVTSNVGSSVPAGDQARMRQALDAAGDADIRAVVIADNTPETAIRPMLRDVANRVGKGKTFVAITADGKQLQAVSKQFKGKEVDQLVTRGTPGASAADQLAGFTERAEQKADEQAHSSLIGMFVTLGVVILLAGAASGAFLVSRKRRRVRDAQQMAELKQGVEEDVTLLGEDIAQLDLDVMDKALATETREDYERAMNSYDAAKSAQEKAARPEDMEGVTTSLEDGRYYMTATRARLAGEPVPERRAPCFFNPQHGPSVQDVTWAPPGGVARSVPACTADANAVLNGREPDVRMVPYGDSRRPYWDAGPAYGPYAGGYYSSYGGMDLISGMMIGTMLGSMMSGGFGGGYAGGDMSGADAGGGWESGGGDFGGGGGDFGGF